VVALTQEFLTGALPAADPDRVLATVLFTDIVNSTGLAAELGDRRWHRVLVEHQELVRRQLARFGGREVQTTGDGFQDLVAGSGFAFAERGTHRLKGVPDSWQLYAVEPTQR
jgi:class 3 adenylate cyclase